MFNYFNVDVLLLANCFVLKMEQLHRIFLQFLKFLAFCGNVDFTENFTILELLSGTK